MTWSYTFISEMVRCAPILSEVGCREWFMCINGGYEYVRHTPMWSFREDVHMYVNKWNVGDIA